MCTLWIMCLIPMNLEQKLEKLRTEITGGNSWARRELSDIRSSMNHVMKVPEKKAAEEFVMSGKKYTWMIFGIGLFILLVTSFLFSYGIYISIVLLIQTIPTLFVSSSLFWKVERELL